MSIQISDATVIVNNDTVGVIPNSVKFSEGLGEQKIRAVSIGGGKTEQIYANDLESNYSMVSFMLPSTIDNIDLLRTWKQNGNANVVQVFVENADGNLTRTFSRAALITNYEVELGVDGNIQVDFHADKAS